jgi:hypothetical protein
MYIVTTKKIFVFLFIIILLLSIETLQFNKLNKIYGNVTLKDNILNNAFQNYQSDGVQKNAVNASRNNLENNILKGIDNASRDNAVNIILQNSSHLSIKIGPPPPIKWSLSKCYY